MGTKRKKAQKNAAFKKTKLKVGKILKKTNTTDSTIESRKVVLLTQLEEQSGSSTAVYSYRGLSLDNLCSQLGHYSKAVRKNAIVGAKQILTSAPNLIETQLRTIIPAFARLISITDADSVTHAQLKSLLELVCTVPPMSISPHFPLFVAHILRGLTHSHESVRSFALSVMHLLLDRYPSLCRDSTDIFQTILHFIGTSRKTSHSTRVLLDFVTSFLKIYDEESAVVSHCIELRLLTEEGVLSRRIDLCPHPKQMDPFHFPVLTTSAAGASSSLFTSPETLLSLHQALSPLVARVAMENDRNLTEHIVQLLALMKRGVERQPNKFMLTDFDERYAQSIDALLKAAKLQSIKDNKRVLAAIATLLQ
ncbi:hypothetical protein PRIPAC_92663 [Pristionchus pacificus]|uniref:Ipi1_N domain-containing protein n=1 Tax=Pristionchus pacificus TaxID=54126 RepID=A0A2A6CHY1_PRIPA|nr:hypothetical protein PRIPAC_92663 [Pristionchus pacificus]|eukprot:PDM77749.1 hypothetical protein PRIPAC_34616 [Pristionchus pacificus]